MDSTDWPAAEFQAHRAHLRAVAYRMLGSLTEADDAVQEAWLRLTRADAGDVRNMRAWLTTVVSRVCLDMLRTRMARREDPARRARAGPGRHLRRGRSRAACAAGRLGRSRAARRPRHAVSCRTARLRPARHLRRPVRADRARPGPFPGRRQAAGQPCQAPAARHYRLSRGRSRQAARGGRRLPGRRPRGGLRGPAGRPRPGRGAPRRRGHRPAGPVPAGPRRTAR